MLYHFFKLKLFVATIFIVQISLILSAAPSIIAHRGGGQNYPENTLLAFEKAIQIGCDGIELDVQVTKDDVVVVYHPKDLSACTNSFGSITSKTWDELAILDPSYNFEPENNYPYRSQGLTIPKLADILKALPNTLIIIDLKSPDYKKLLSALLHTITDEEAKRLVFYSTDKRPIEYLNKIKPHWKTFEPRDNTRLRLLELNQGHEPSVPPSSSWIGFELKRAMLVKETFTLGEGESKIEFKLWSPKVVSQLKNGYKEPKVVLFGINTEEDWKEALQLNVDMIYTDNPKKIVELSAKN